MSFEVVENKCFNNEEINYKEIKMKKIIALKGKGNSGKTQTIRKVFNELCAQDKDTKVEILIDNADIKAIVTIKGIKIGIESQGDPNSRLKDSLNEFSKKDCDIIVCATRTSGMTVEWVKNLDGFTPIWINQIIGVKSLIEQINEVKALEILSEVLTEMENFFTGD